MKLCAWGEGDASFHRSPAKFSGRIPKKGLTPPGNSYNWKHERERDVHLSGLRRDGSVRLDQRTHCGVCRVRSPGACVMRNPFERLVELIAESNDEAERTRKKIGTVWTPCEDDDETE